MKFTSQSIEAHEEVPQADEGELERVEARGERRLRAAKPRDPAGNACYVVSVELDANPSAASSKLAEIVGLVRAQDDRVVGAEVQLLLRVDPRTYLGRGAAAELASRAIAAGADMLVLDAELSPSQLRNLEDVCGIAICDREAVILNVFLRHARTRLARTQVEIAHLEYLRPRIRGLGLDMDQQAGGVMRARGPGETASELMARQLDGRMADLKRTLRRLEVAGGVQRDRRQSAAGIALVGYTNAGKTSLMNALTGAGLSARDMPFETLDTTSRCLTRHGGDVVVSDTVGFIRRLPERLLASFESTLAEAKHAALLVIVVDLSDAEWPLHLDTTHRVLHRLQAHDAPRFYVFNKCDLVTHAPSREETQLWVGEHPFVRLSSHDAAAVQRLRGELIRQVRSTYRRARIFVPFAATSIIATIYGQCQVLATDEKAHGIRFTIEAAPRVIARLRGQSERLCK